MYPKELCEDSDENDVEFKRVDFSNALIDKFAEDKSQNYQFSVAKFTKTYTELCDLTNDYDKLKSSINKIKSESETFNGTYIGTSMEKTLNKFDSVDYSHKKYIILLTDGETTEGTGWSSIFESYPSAEDIKREALEKGVVVFAVGLGNNVDKDYLMKMSKETGGDYFIASDADSLNEIYNKIASSIEYNEVDTDDDKISDAIMIADTQFDAKRDGFSFPNGIIYKTAEGGFCYGMAEFAERYYTKTLPMSLDEADINNFYTIVGEYLFDQNEWKAAGYDLTNDPFFGKMQSPQANKIYDYVPKVYNMQYDDSLRIAKDPDADFTSSASATLKNSGFVVKRLGEKQYAYLDVNDTNFQNSAENTEVQLFRALARLYVTQKYKTNLDNFIDVNDKPEETINTLIGLLQNKVPSLIDLGGHAVNATKIVRDIDNPNKMMLYIYDNNYPGEERVVYITRSKIALNGEEKTNYTINYTTGDYEMEQLRINSERVLE